MQIHLLDETGNEVSYPGYAPVDVGDGSDILFAKATATMVGCVTVHAARTDDTLYTLTVPLPIKAGVTPHLQLDGAH